MALPLPKYRISILAVLQTSEKIQYGIDLIKEQKSDLLLFTGDIVNNKADEMDNWMDAFR